MNSNVFIYWWFHLNTQFLALNEHTSNKPNRAFISSIKSLIEQTRTSSFRTSKGLESVHLLVIELEHPIFGLITNFEMCHLHFFISTNMNATQISVNTLASSNKIARCLHIILAIKSSPEIVFFLVCMSLGAPWQLLGDVVRTSRSVF